MASRMRLADRGQATRRSASVRCSSWWRGMISSSYGVPLQNGQTQTTSSLANTTRSPSASSASTVAHRMQPPSKRAKARSSSRISPGTNGSPSSWPWGWASDAPASRPWLMIACV